MSIVPSPPANATPTARGLMSAADKSKLDGLAPSPVGSVTAGNGLALTGDVLSMGAASDVSAGAVTTSAQTFAGAKTLSGAILNGVSTIAEAVTSLVRAVGASLVLRSSLGAGASDVAVKVGSSVADASVNAGAKLFSVRTGLGGVEVESFFIDKFGNVTANAQNTGSGTQTFYGYATATGKVVYVGQGSAATVPIFQTTQDFVGITSRLMASGVLSQAGTDSSATPGAATINKPTGKSTIASGATTVRITNNLVAAGDQVHITPHANFGAYYWVTTGAGYFDLNLSAAAPADCAFCWTVSKRI